MADEKHIHSFYDKVIPPTCKENGYTLHKCQCGYEYKDSFVPAGDHNFDILENVNPTCTESGKRHCRCTVCGEEKTVELSPMGHSFGNWNVQKVPTCTESGSQVRICTRCGQSEEAEIEPIGHKLTSPKNSETQKGYIDYFCENCGQTITQPSSSQKAKNRFLAHKKLFISIISLVSVGLIIGLFFAVKIFFIPFIIILAPTRS